MLNRKILVTLVITIIAGNLFASFPYVRNFTKNISKVGNQNWDIIQHDNQWMYFANNMGLLEYDGSQWAIYPNQNHSLVRSLYYDKESNRIYAGAYNEFGYYERSKNGVLFYKKLNNTNNVNIFSDIWNIHKLNNDFVYQADFDIVITKGDSMQVYRFNDKINFSTVINQKLIIAQQNKGVRYFDGKSFVDFNNVDVLKKKLVRAILPYESNKMLFVTDVHGIYIYNGNEFSKLNTDIDSFLVNNEVFCAAIKNNILAIGTIQNGLVLKNLSNNTSVFLNNETGLQNNTVLSITFDNNNNLWLGLDKGIDYVMLNLPLTDLIGNPNFVGAGYASLLYNSKLYLATNQGLYCANYDTVKQLVTSKVLPISQIKGQVWNLCEINGEMFCSSDKGLFVFNNNEFYKINGLLGVWNVKPLKGYPDVLLGAEYNEFFVLKKNNGRWIKTNAIRGFEESPKLFLVDNDAKIWVSHNTKGIYRLSLNDYFDSFEKVELFGIQQGLSSLRNVSISEYKNQIIASTENGFYYFNKKSDVFVKSDWLNRLFQQPKFVSNLYTDASNNIWSVASSNIMIGLKQHNSIYEVDSVSFVYLKNKLLPSFEHVSFLPHNKALIATENGFSLYDKSRTIKKGEHSKLAFKSIYITGFKDSLLSGFLDYQSDNAKQSISYKCNSLRFEFVCSEFTSENSSLYSVKLENYDNKWSAFSNSRTKEYAKIPPGDYIFKVKAKNPFNRKIQTIEYAFTIRPPWYNGFVAKVVYFMFILLAVYLAVRFIKHRSLIAARKMELKKEKELKEQEEQFLFEAKEKEKEIIALRNKQLEHELRHKSQDLANSTMNVIRKNEILLEMIKHLNTINDQINENKEPKSITKQILVLQKEINNNIENDNNWLKFQENFDLVYENYLTRLSDAFPSLTQNDKKICAYLRMDLSSKDIAPLVNTTYQSVEMTRYRLRKKLNLDRSVNLSDFLQHF